MNRVGYVILYIILASCSREKTRQPGLCLSFDDRSINAWYEMRDLLKKYDTHVTFFVSRFDSLTAAEIEMLKELQKEGHEIGSHGALHTNAEVYIKENSYEEYLKNEIQQNILSMNKNGFYPTSFAYPYGAKYWFTDFLLLKRFKVLRGVASMNAEKDITSINEIYYSFNNDHALSALGLDGNSGITKDVIKKGIRRASDRNEVLLLYGHCPTKNSINSAYKFDITILEYILIEAKKNNLKYFRISELVD